ncbi:MAG: M48 family metallopeptidase [Deltaproteobacteria bacterium]|nr:M48 family metallopeptidase [Deltaproteobacteria bacterium]
MVWNPQQPRRPVECCGLTLLKVIEPNHTHRFWKIVSVKVPRWEQATTWLCEHGDLLEVDF